jgi:formylglycine-generating enzyme required for sulfatase activity/serine/threonine protein kinase
MTAESEKSLSDDATFAGRVKQPVSSRDVSIGDERTVGDEMSGQDTLIDDIKGDDFETRYRIEGQLGQGGMGAVLLATDTRLDRKVAIKRILGEAAGNRMAVNRFLTEAKSIAALNHPNIVQIYDYGRAKDGPFLIMEFVDGGSLLDRCRDGAVPLEDTIDLACQLCDGLAKAHDLGIIHRDIKPANVLLTKDGVPKLTDFGLAKAQAGDHGQTMTGAVLGTPDFMPPEQRQDASLVDHRSDLWSLAATVYQMLTGRSPKIIRFNDVPAALQNVLGKALEDGKDARYQTAREFRDALKESLRAGEAASRVLDSGECPACGTPNENSRKFCRKCASPLEAPCLSCNKPMPLWEDVCGDCGDRQSRLAESKRSEMAAEQARVEGLLGDFAFDEAARIATALRDEPHPRLSFLKRWADDFLGEVEQSRTRTIERARVSMAEATAHERVFDYSSAMSVLESVPETMRSVVLPGAGEPVATALARVGHKQAESRRLESVVQEQIAAKAIDGLLPDVERLLSLQPNRSDVQKFRQQLIDRQQRKEATRDAALATARSLMMSHDYDGAIAAVVNVPEGLVTDEIRKIRSDAENCVSRASRIGDEIRAAVAGKRLDYLLPTVDAYLALKPTDKAMLRLRQSLTAREEKIAEEVNARVNQARGLYQECRFAEAATVLKAIPSARRGVADHLIEQYQTAACERSRVLQSLASAATTGYEEALLSAVGYGLFLANSRLEDLEFRATEAKVEAARAEAEAARVEKKHRRTLLRFIGAVIGAAAAIAILVLGISLIRSGLRAAAIKSANESSRWDYAIALDPTNTVALQGRALRRLTASPWDIDGAFADIELAERFDRESVNAKAVRARAHATRAIAHVAAGHLNEADLDLAEASRLGCVNQSLSAAREAIAEAWVERARKAVRKRDVTEVRIACDAAAKAGAMDTTLADVWQQFAAECVEKMDAIGLATAVLAAKQRGLPAAEVAGWWLRYGCRGAQIGDVDAVRNACEAMSKSKINEKDFSANLQGAYPRSPHELWRCIAKASADRSDADGVKTACAAAEKLGCPSSDLVEMWLQWAQIAGKNGDLKSVRSACDEAVNAGAPDEAVSLLRAKETVLDALSMFSRGETDEAITLAAAAISKYGSVANAVLIEANTNSLREALVNEYRRRFDSTLRLKDAIEVAAVAQLIDPQARFWLEKISPEALRTTAPDALLSLSPSVLVTLPPAVLASLPQATVVAIPALKNSIGIELKLLPAGVFAMGRVGGGDETSHQVKLTTPFFLGVYEVTNAQWKRVMGSVPSSWKDGDQPVENVSWEEAVEFCGKLSALPEERKAGRVYRLPTEAEWEYACRAGTTTQYSFGDDETRLGDYGWFDGNSGSKTHAVGQKKPNAWGLYDMHGNVWEWCSDWYEAYSDRAVTNPQGPSSGSARVSRGGGWNYTSTNVRSAHRDGNVPSSRYGSLGFRLALSPSGAESPEAGTDQGTTTSAPSEDSPPAAVIASGSMPISAAAASTLPETIASTVGIKLKLIPAGTFMMGSAHGSETLHRVKLTRPFYVGVTEVTNAQWKRVMVFPSPSKSQGDNHPVAYVSQDQIEEFCRKLSWLPEERKAGRVYRLPTEAEWEYACRAGTTTEYSFGDDASLMGDYGWFDGNSDEQTHPVGLKKPNAWGLHDMHGNVYEWCSDWFGFIGNGEATDPTGAGPGGDHVLRGGCYLYAAQHCRSAARGSSRHGTNRQEFRGFRLAVSPSGAESPEAGK